MTLYSSPRAVPLVSEIVCTVIHVSSYSTSGKSLNTFIHTFVPLFPQSHMSPGNFSYWIFHSKLSPKWLNHNMNQSQYRTYFVLPKIKPEAYAISKVIPVSCRLANRGGACTTIFPSMKHCSVRMTHQFKICKIEHIKSHFCLHFMNSVSGTSLLFALLI